MPLKRATKSIPLTGATTEEVNDLLLQPPGMQFVLNGRRTKQDEVVKGKCYKDGVASGYSNYTQNVYGFWGRGNKLAAIGNNEVVYSRDAGATWKTNLQKTDLLGMERVLSTAEQTGGANFSWSPIGNWTDATPDSFDVDGYAVAFERVTHNSGSITNTRSVVIQGYDTDGTLTDEQVFLDCHSPRVKPMQGLGMVWFVNTSGQLRSRAVAATAGAAVIGTSDLETASLSIQQFCQAYDTSNETYNITGALNPGDMRLGFSRDLHYNNGAMVAFNEWTSFDGLVGWKEDDGTGVIKVQETFLGALTGSSLTIGTDTATWSHRILDVCINSAGSLGFGYVLYAKINKITGLCELRCYQITMSGFTLTYDLAITTLSNDIPINGSVRTDTAGAVWMAATVTDGTPVQEMYDTAGRHGVSWYRFPAGTWSGATLVTHTDKIYSHRLVSGLAGDKDNDMHTVVQQWDNWNPDEEGSGGADPDVPTITPTHKKPVTSILVRLLYDAADRHVPMATFDAGQSKAILPGMEEQNVSWGGDLYYWSNNSAGTDQYNEFWYGNRVLLTATDDFYYMDTTAAPTYVSPSDPKSDGRASLLAGSARFSVYHLNSNIQPMSTEFSDGIMIGTSLPTWYDGGYFVTEMQPLDSPEIVGYTESGDGGTYMAYANLGIGGEIPKAYQAVIGFYDNSGRVHRSAPSIPMYIGNLDASGSTNVAGRFYVTPPITMSRDRNYFLEMYESYDGSAPQLCGTQEITTPDAGDRLSISLAVNMNPTTVISAEIDIIDFRASKTLYTSGNVLAADPWPSFDIVVKSGRRLFAHSISDPNTIYYSKTFEQNIAPEFSASLTVTLGNEVVTAMGAFDDKVVLFTSDSCWLMYGTGPDNTGANGDFFIDKLPFNLGCTDRDSVLAYQDGLAFFSNTTNEFHLITRDLLLKDIGDVVKGLSSGIDDVLAAVAYGADYELRWYCDFTQPTQSVAVSNPTGTPFQPPIPYLEKNTPGAFEVMFVYNYKYATWDIRTYATAISNGLAKGGVTAFGDNRLGVLSTSYVFREESDGNYGSSDLMYWETPWINVNQLQDFGRFYGATIIGKYLSSWDDLTTVNEIEAGDLDVTFRYDYEGPNGNSDTRTWRANVDLDPAMGERMQFRARPQQQKCQAIKIIFQETATSGVEVFEPAYTTGKGFSLVSLDLHYGSKGGSGDKNLGSRRRVG